MPNIANLSKQSFAVIHQARPEIGCEFLIVDVASGWDDVRKFVGRALSFEGRDFAYTGWNSDKNQAYFRRNFKGPELCAQLATRQLNLDAE